MALPIAGLLKGAGAVKSLTGGGEKKVKKEKVLPAAKEENDQKQLPGKKSSALAVRPKAKIAPRIRVTTFKTAKPKDGSPGKGGALVYDDLSNRLNTLVQNTNVLNQFAKNDLENQKEETKAEKQSVEKAKNAAAESKAEAKAEQKTFKKSLKAPKMNIFGGLFKIIRNIAFGTLVMETLRFFSDPEKSKSVLKFMEDNMLSILGGIGAAIAAVVIAPLFGPGALLLSAIGMVTKVALVLGRFALGFALTPAGRLLITALLARKAYYDDFLGFRSTLEGQMTKEIEKGYTRTYGDRAAEGKALTKIRDNYGRIASAKDVEGMSAEEKSIANYLRLYDEEIRKKDKADPKKLKMLAEQITIQGKPLSYWLSQYYEKSEAGLPQTSISKKLYPSQQPPQPEESKPVVKPTETKIPGVSLGEAAGYSERRGRVHAGRDIPAPSGQPLIVQTDSTITATGYDSGYGNYVVFKDANGLEHMYGHMIAPTTYRKGDTVSAGTVVGNVGSTGRSSGPHLHWEVSPNMGEVGFKRSNVFDPILDYGFNQNSPFAAGNLATKKPDDQATAVARQTTYEQPGDQEVLVTMPPQQAPPMMPSSGGGGIAMPQRASMETVLNNYYRFQVLGFLYKQG